ncbi:uncharacterized transporter slc-17.2-like [Liolophura sinensis]|uniref:uncharacterized transporter slc-17.2-like n=1 Tax=Liolophura sinensis TaxID=3198878 RepID=UPI003159399C
MAPQYFDTENEEAGSKRSNGGLPGMFSAIRWRVTVCGFFGILVSQTFRVSFTVGVSCMVGPHSMLQENLTTSPVPGHGYQRTWNTSWNGNFSGIVETNPAEVQGEFDWNKKTQGTLLSAYFYGHLVSQVPGGWLSRRYGTRWVVAIAMMAAMACTALTPICARTHVYLLFVIRVILGAVQVGTSGHDQPKMAPWCSILASPPVWGTALGYFGIDWVNNTFSLGIILYMGEVLKFKITSSGILGSLPPVVCVVSSMFVGCLSDFILNKKILSRVNTRRLFQTLFQRISSSELLIGKKKEGEAFVPMGILLAATGFVTKEHASLAVACLVISQMFFGLSLAGFLISVMDFAPRFSGEISGALNIFGTMTGLFVPSGHWNANT